MSTIVTSNVSDGTLSIPTTYVTNGSAKVWANLNGTGTIALRDSLNISSVVDNGSGDYTHNFTNNMADANWSAVGSVQASSATSALYFSNSQTGYNASGPTVSSYRSYIVTGSFTATDRDNVSFHLNGDLA